MQQDTYMSNFFFDQTLNAAIVDCVWADTVL